MSGELAGKNTKNGSPESSEFEFVEGATKGMNAMSMEPPPPASTPMRPPGIQPPINLPSPPSNIARPPPVITAAPPPPQQPPAVVSSQPSASSTAIPIGDDVGGRPNQGPEVVEIDEEGPGLLDWMKGASGGIWSKMAQKTKASVEVMITTLDPQMRDYIYSGGDIHVLVASSKPAKVNPIRTAFQKVFGLASVDGLETSPLVSVAEQPVGFAAGRQGANERIQMLRSKRMVDSNLPIVAVEGFLLEVGEDSWVEMSCLILSDAVNQITLTSYSQPTPVDARFVEMAKQKTDDSYPKKWSGFAVSIGAIISSTLNIDHTQWQEASTGVSRGETIRLAAEALAGQYKRALAAKSAQ